MPPPTEEQIASGGGIIAGIVVLFFVYWVFGLESITGYFLLYFVPVYILILYPRRDRRMAEVADGMWQRFLQGCGGTSRFGSKSTFFVWPLLDKPQQLPATVTTS
jgi:hypothetical protein